MATDAKCPHCGEAFDDSTDLVIECPKCGAWGSTACCNAGGVGVWCIECEEGDSSEEVR